MATWEELVAYVKTEYKVADEQEGMLRLIFNTEGDRSQSVYLWKAELMDGAEQWVQIESPFAKADGVDLRKALEAIGGMAVGGAAVMNDYVFFRHTVPLANLDLASEFERPFMLVTMTADRLEEMLGQGDEL